MKTLCEWHCQGRGSQIFYRIVTGTLVTYHLPLIKGGNQGPERGRGLPSVTQHTFRVAQVWRAEGLLFVCGFDAKSSAGEARVTCPAWGQTLLPTAEGCWL
jgi:hypothetical protein